MTRRFDGDDLPLALQKQHKLIELPNDDDAPLTLVAHSRKTSAASSAIMSHMAPSHSPRPSILLSGAPSRLPPGAMPSRNSLGPAVDPRHSVYSLASQTRRSPSPALYDGRGSSYFDRAVDYKDVELARTSTYDDFNNIGGRRSFAFERCVVASALAWLLVCFVETARTAMVACTRPARLLASSRQAQASSTRRTVT